VRLLRWAALLCRGGACSARMPCARQAALRANTIRWAGAHVPWTLRESRRSTVTHCTPLPAPAHTQNPAYKGKWSAPLIDNPKYKGEWKPKEIPNPEHVKDPAPLTNIGKVRVDCC